MNVTEGPTTAGRPGCSTGAVLCVMVIIFFSINDDNSILEILRNDISTLISKDINDYLENIITYDVCELLSGINSALFILLQGQFSTTKVRAQIDNFDCSAR